MYFKCQKAVWSTSTWWVFLRTFQNTAIRNALMKLPLSWSPRAKKLHLRIPDRNQDRREQTAQQDLSPAASLMWDRLLWASSWRRMESQKPWELLSACQSHSHPCASLKPENSASQLLCEVGNYSLPWQKWGVRRLHCSPGVPQEVWGKAEDEFNLPLSPLPTGFWHHLHFCKLWAAWTTDSHKVVSPPCPVCLNFTDWLKLYRFAAQ